MKIIIEYTEGGNAISDFYVDRWLEDVLSRDHSHGLIKVSNETPINAVRQAIVDGRISHEEVAFIYKDHILWVNEYGAISNWPDGFCDKNCRFSENILRKAMNKRKKEDRKKDLSNLIGKMILHDIDYDKWYDK